MDAPVPRALVEQADRGENPPGLRRLADWRSGAPRGQARMWERIASTRVELGVTLGGYEQERVIWTLARTSSDPAEAA